MVSILQGHVDYKRDTYNYSEYDNLPLEIREKSDPWRYMIIGVNKLVEFDGKNIKGNLEGVKEILRKYFCIELEDLVETRIYVGEYRIVFLWFEDKKIKVYVDYD